MYVCMYSRIYISDTHTREKEYSTHVEHTDMTFLMMNNGLMRIKNSRSSSTTLITKDQDPLLTVILRATDLSIHYTKLFLHFRNCYRSFNKFTPP